jgi:glutathione S-transferase
MITIQSTAGCVNTPAVLLALREAGVTYQTEIVRDGWFTERFGIPGPAYVEDDWTLVETSAILRHVARAHGAGTLWPAELRAQAEVDRWADFFARRISRASGDDLLALLRRLDAQLEGRDWVTGAFTIADCFALLSMRRPLPSPAELPRVAAYLERVVRRSA